MILPLFLCTSPIFLFFLAAKQITVTLWNNKVSLSRLTSRCLLWEKLQWMRKADAVLRGRIKGIGILKFNGILKFSYFVQIIQNRKNKNLIMYNKENMKSVNTLLFTIYFGNKCSRFAYAVFTWLSSVFRLMNHTVHSTLPQTSQND